MFHLRHARTFGDAHRLQNSINEQEPVHALPVGLNLTDEVLVIGRADIGPEYLMELRVVQCCSHVDLVRGKPAMLELS